MSVLSDSTDVLLLIPPDFFLVSSDSEESADFPNSTEQLLVSDLISQVNDLEGRICMIENHKVFSDCKMPANENLQLKKHFGSADFLNASYKSNYTSHSLQNTPVKNKCATFSPKIWQTEFVSSQYVTKKDSDKNFNLLVSSDYIDQKEKDDKLLHDIKNFFENRESHLNISNDFTNKCPDKLISDNKVDDNTCLSTAVFNLNKVNDLLKQLEETQAQIEQKLQQRENCQTKNESETSDFSNIKSLDNQKKFTEDFSNESIPKVKTVNSTANCSDFNHYEKNLSDVKLEVDNSNLELYGPPVIKQKSSENINDENLQDFSGSNELLCLSKLWMNGKKADDETFQDDYNIFKQKYLEEECRRKHCEGLIHNLQLKLLEEQQKVAVAVKVDKEKNEAISKLNKALSKLLNNLKESEIEKKNFEKKLISEREKFDREMSATCQTVKKYETELSKALNLAHDYKEKCEMSEQNYKKLSSESLKEVSSLRKEIKGCNEKLQTEQSKREELEKLISTKENKFIQASTKIIEMQNHIKELKKSFEEKQADLELSKSEKEKLCEKIKVEKNRVMCLEQNKKVLLQNVEDLKKREKALKENIKAMNSQAEKVKLELKTFYQEQVEKIVQEKLIEFQEQLSVAEKTLQKEIEEREKSVTESAVQQIQYIIEKHSMEINILEEKHKEEVELCKIKMTQAEEKAEELQKKLDMYSAHKSEIAQKLHNVMETQWQEALKIITASSPQCQKNSFDDNDLASVKEITRQNTFTVNSCALSQCNVNSSSVVLDNEKLSVSPDCEPSFQLGQITSRIQKISELEDFNRDKETSMDVKVEKKDSLKKYIQMLLERPPGLPVDDAIEKSVNSTACNFDRTSNLLQWQQVLINLAGNIQ